MPVKIELAIEPGWNINNYHDKTDPAIVARFIDEKTNRILFIYAPKFNDIQFWVTIFETIGRYEISKNIHKCPGNNANTKIPEEAYNCMEGNSNSCKKKNAFEKSNSDISSRCDK